MELYSRKLEYSQKIFVSIGKYRFRERVKTMILDFENTYMKIYWRLQRAQWDNYFENGDYNLSDIDDEIYKVVCEFDNVIEQTDRRSKIAWLLINRELVDKSPQISMLRNRIDDLDNYNMGIPEHVKKDRYAYKSELALRMKEDVLALMALRNKLSKERGFSSYPDLVFAVEEVDKSEVIRLLNSYVDNKLPKVLEIIKSYNISWETWFSDLRKIQASVCNYQPEKLINSLMDKLNLIEVKEKLKIEYKEKGYSGCASEIAPNDIRIVVEPISSLFNIKVLFHEVGHAITYASNNEKGLFKILSASFDEAMAVVMEYVASKILLSKEEQEKMAEIEVLEYTRCAISALYEFSLWENQKQAEELYKEYYSKLRFEIKNPSIWASDTFRSIDPVYIYSYPLGAILGEKIVEYLEKTYKNDYEEWGNCLKENIYFDGRKRTFDEKFCFLK